MMKKMVQLGVILAVGLSAGAAFGAGDGFEAPGVAEPSIPWAAIAYAVVGAIAIALIGFRKSRRSTMK
jgi:ABC-type Fe3+-siderophore transport system permease subunit